MPRCESRASGQRCQFCEFTGRGDPVENARFYDEEGADELVFLDITASHEKRDIILDVVYVLRSRCLCLSLLVEESGPSLILGGS